MFASQSSHHLHTMVYPPPRAQGRTTTAVDDSALRYASNIPNASTVSILCDFMLRDGKNSIVSLTCINIDRG